MAKDWQPGPGPVGKPAGARGEELDVLLARAEDASGAGSFERDLRTGTGRYSPGFCRVYGVPDGVEVTRDMLMEHVCDDDRELVDAEIQRAIRNREPFTFEVRITRFDGPERVIRARGAVEFGASGEPEKLVGSIMDVTEEVEARAARELLSRVVDSSDDAIITQARDGTITSWNRGAEQLYLYTAEEAIGQPSAIIEQPDTHDEEQELLARVFSGDSIRRMETERVRKDGRRLTVSLTISPIRDANGRVISASGIARDITERRLYEERLRHLADHDQLTGLFNRRRFDEELKRELARSRRYDARGAMLSIDIDNFKAINDAAGHAAGDVVLVEVSSTLKRRFRQTDVVARLGGDEFAVLLPEGRSRRRPRQRR